MGYHHLAMAARDMQAIHDFYEDCMGFELVKVEIGPVPEGGWAKHFFYRMNGAIGAPPSLKFPQPVRWWVC